MRFLMMERIMMIQISNQSIVPQCWHRGEWDQKPALVREISGLLQLLP